MYEVVICTKNEEIFGKVSFMVNEKYGIRIAVSRMQQKNEVNKENSVRIYVIDEKTVTGKELQECVREKDHDAKIIQIGTVNFDREEEILGILEALEQIIQQQEKLKSENLAVKCRGGIITLNISKIDYIESDRRKVYFHEKERVYTTYMKLNELEQMLPMYLFRCHQSYIVNINRIKKITNRVIDLESGEQIPVSRSYYRRTKQAVLDFYQGKVL